MIMHTNLSKMKNQTLPTCLQGNYRDSLGEFSNMSYGMIWAGRVKHDTITMGPDAWIQLYESIVCTVCAF